MIRGTLRPASVLSFSLLFAAVIVGADDPKPIWTLRENLVIGGAGAQADMFSQIAGVQVDDQGRIYVLDSQDCLIRVFDAAGNLTRSFGRKGKGPGEFEYPMGMSVSGQTLSVFDMGNRRISRFGLDGGSVGEIDLKAVGSMMFMPRAVCGEIVYGLCSNMQKDNSYTSQLLRYDPAERKSRILVESPRTTYSPNKHNPLAGGYLIELLPDGKTVWVHTKEYVLNIMKADGAPELRRTKEYKRVRITEKCKQDMKQRFKENPTLKDYTLDFPEFYPPISYIAVADNGWIIVAVQDADAQQRFDVFGGPQYEYLGSFTHSKQEGLFLIKGGMGYFHASNEEGFPTIKRYEIEVLK